MTKRKVSKNTGKLDFLFIQSLIPFLRIKILRKGIERGANRTTSYLLYTAGRTSSKDNFRLTIFVGQVEILIKCNLLKNKNIVENRKTLSAL